MNRKKTAWIALSVLIAMITIYCVFSNNKAVSPLSLLGMLKQASVTWLAMTFISMIGFIVFEGLSLQFSLCMLGTHTGFNRALLYSAGDIFFSALTPSASGGQPASAFFMHKSNISGATITVCLIVNLIMYTLSGLTIGMTGIFIRPDLITKFDRISVSMIFFGIWAGVMLTVLFIPLLIKSSVIRRAGSATINTLWRMHLIKDREVCCAKLDSYISDYELCSATIHSNPKMFLVVYLFDLAQRFSQVCVTPLLHRAVLRDDARDMAGVWSVQALTMIGSNFIPIPGGMGAADYLMINGLGSLFERDYAYELQMLSRGLSFYICTVVSGVIVFTGYLLIRKKGGD